MDDNLKNKKYLIASGCSYGKTIDALTDNKFKRYLDIEDDVVMIDLGKSSQSSGYSADSIIHCVNLLLSEGVDSKNIYVLNEWTEAERPHDVFPMSTSNEFEKYINSPNKKLSLTESCLIVHTIHSGVETKLSNLLNKKRIVWNRGLEKDFECGICLIDNLFYMSARNCNAHDYDNTPFKHDVRIMQDRHQLISFEELIISYLNNIIRLQNFLKLNKIKYKFNTIYSQFSNFELDKNVKKCLEPPYKISKDKITFVIRKEHKEYRDSLTEKNDIVNVFPGCKSKFNEIDLSNFWFYEKNNYRFGGIDEYAFDNFGDYGYFTTSDFPQDDYVQMMPNYGSHPEPVVYFLLSEELLEDCEFINLKPNSRKQILRKIEEDLNSDVVVNGFVASKKQRYVTRRLL